MGETGEEGSEGRVGGLRLREGGGEDGKVNRLFFPHIWTKHYLSLPPSLPPFPPYLPHHRVRLAETVTLTPISSYFQTRKNPTPPTHPSLPPSLPSLPPYLHHRLHEASSHIVVHVRLGTMEELDLVVSKSLGEGREGGRERGREGGRGEMPK